MGPIIEFIKPFLPLGRELLLAVLAAGLGSRLFFALWFRKERRLLRNLQKRIAIFRLTSNPSDMQMELEMIQSNGLFAEPKVFNSDPRTLEWAKDYALLIIAVDETSSEETFAAVYEKARAAEMPVVIYTMGRNRIPICDSPIVQTYSKRVVVNHPLRLLSDIFTILSTLPGK